MYRKIILLGCIFSALNSFAQQYVVKEFKGSYSINNYCENLGDILVAGYLSGEIQAYAFAYRDSVLKFKPLTVSNWEPNKDYLFTDTIFYKGKYYTPEYDLVRENIPPDSLAEDVFLRWSNVLPKAISTRYFFPELKDTLSKSEFLKRMLATPRILFDEWDKSSTYYIGDVFSYKGVNYECIKDNVQGVSPENEDYWMPTHQGDEVFFRPYEVSEVSILFHYTLQNRDTVWNPQILTIHINRNAHPYGIALPVMHFYYHEVLTYLQKRYSPVFNANPEQALLKTPIDLSGIQRDTKSKTGYTFPEAVTRHQHLCCARLATIDSVAPNFDNTSIKPITATRYFFLEQNIAWLDSGHNGGISATMPEFWKLLYEKYNNRSLRQCASRIKFYPSNYTWRAKIGENDNSGFRQDLSLELYAAYDTLRLPEAFVALSVVYRKELTGTKWSIVPYQLVVQYNSSRSSDLGVPEWFTVYWSDLITVLKDNKSKAIKKLLIDIEKGKLKFMSTEVVYGLMGAQ